MAIFRTNLLIRDNRKDVFEAAGCTLQYRTLNDAEFESELRKKLVEEANEAATEQNTEYLLSELADVQFVVNELLKLKGFTVQDVETKMAQREARLGGFKKRIFSELLTAPEDAETTHYHRQHPDKYPEVK